MTALLLLATAAAANAQTFVSIYRNDSTFNQVRLIDGTLISHVSDKEGPEAEVPDWIFGKQRVPLTSIDSCVVSHSDIPVLRFEFPDYPEAETVWSKEDYIDANLDIEGNGFTDNLSGLTLQIRGRGNSTWGMPKKPMRLKFSKKTSICGFPKMKSYVLLNNYLDPTMMKNVLAMWLANRLEVPYANTMVPCHVFINGNYAGAYTLTEKVGINAGSVDIDETQGMLFELSTEYDEPYKFRSALWDLPVMVKDPDFDELYEDDPSGLTPSERLALWQGDFNYAEGMVWKGKGAEVFDVESVVNFMLVSDVAANSELGWPKSLYIHKKSLGDEGKYCFGPVWDFDAAFNHYRPDEESVYTSVSPEIVTWLTPFMRTLLETPEIQARYKERLQEFKETIFPEMLEFFDSYASMIRPSAKLNGLRWPVERIYGSWAYLMPSYEAERETAALRDWLIKRVDYLTR